MFLRMRSPLKSGGTLLYLLNSAWVRHCHRLLVWVVDWCASQLVRLICWQIIWQQTIQGVCWSASLAIRLLDLPYLPSGRVRLLLNLDLFWGTGQLGMFLIFPKKRTADGMASRLSVVFWPLVRLGSITVCRRQTNVTRIPKGPPSASGVNYLSDFHNISIGEGTRWSVWCRFVSVDLWNAVVCLESPSLLIEMVWVHVLHDCACPIHWKVYWRVAGIEYRAGWVHRAFDRINHQGILYNWSVLGALKVLCCLFWYSFYQINQSTLWWMVVGLN